MSNASGDLQVVAISRAIRCWFKSLAARDEWGTILMRHVNASCLVLASYGNRQSCKRHITVNIYWFSGHCQGWRAKSVGFDPCNILLILTVCEDGWVCFLLFNSKTSEQIVIKHTFHFKWSDNQLISFLTINNIAQKEFRKLIEIDIWKKFNILLIQSLHNIY